ncbi:MAG: polysaccharide deacetylase family protein [Candidatus Brocadiaceae bacterium]|nr:polysaccharide deacetylase family protein [Candidatus Brocadiaceae bacterium]
MNRFGVATLAVLACWAGVVLALDGAARWWVGGALTVAYLVALGVGVAFPRAGFFCRAFCRGDAARRQVAFTFDDGPDPAATPALLDLLREQRVPAAFFCIGQKAQEHPDVVRRAVREGHVVGNHTFRHSPWTNFLSAHGLLREIGRAQDALGLVVGRRPRYLRSPVGLTNPRFPGALCRSGTTFIGWDVRSLDRGAAPDAVVARVCRKARPGSVLLMHDGGADAEALVEAVSRIIAQLRDRGYAFVALEDMGAGPPYVDG